jgi:hypothetical protein
MASDRLDRDHERLKALELKTDKAVELVKELTEQLGRVNDKLDLLQF